MNSGRIVATCSDLALTAITEICSDLRLAHDEIAI